MVYHREELGSGAFGGSWMMRGPGRLSINKKDIVRLTDVGRDELAAVIKKLEGTSREV